MTLEILTLATLTEGSKRGMIHLLALVGSGWTTGLLVLAWSRSDSGGLGTAGPWGIGGLSPSRHGMMEDATVAVSLDCFLSAHKKDRIHFFSADK